MGGRTCVVGWKTCKMLPFCFSPILITSRKDTRLFPWCIFAFQGSLGTRLSTVIVKHSTHVKRWNLKKHVGAHSQAFALELWKVWESDQGMHAVEQVFPWNKHSLPCLSMLQWWGTSHLLEWLYANRTVAGYQSVHGVLFTFTEKQIDIESVDLKKLRVKELKRILNTWDEECRGCAEKSDFISKIQEVKHLHVHTELWSDTTNKSKILFILSW